MQSPQPVARNSLSGRHLVQREVHPSSSVRLLGYIIKFQTNSTHHIHDVEYAAGHWHYVVC